MIENDFNYLNGSSRLVGGLERILNTMYSLLDFAAKLGGGNTSVVKVYRQGLFKIITVNRFATIWCRW